MERLTKRDGLIVKTVFESDFGTQNILNRLADYEDLEEQGRLIELPCKVGDMVFRVIEMSTGKTLNCYGAIIKPTIKQFIRGVEVTRHNLLDICENIGKTVFLTKEEALAKLKELKEGENKWLDI